MILPLLSSPRVVLSAPDRTKIGVFEVVEFSVDTGATYKNPFDPDEVAVDGEFTCGSVSRDVPAFWNGRRFLLRFAPPRAGVWRLTAVVKSGLQSVSSDARTFRVGASDRGGYVSVSPSNPRYFQLSTGAGFVPIGLNLCWPDKTGPSSYDRRFAKLKSVGGNFARIWTTQDRQLETKKTGLGRFDEGAAASYDEIFKLADKYGIRLMLTLDDYRVWAKTDYFNAHWADSPYNTANGGPLKEPTDFFADPICQTLYRRRLRYLVARYGAYPSLAFWELYNEQDNIPKPGVPIGWFRDMTNYLASIDPARHSITTSYSWDDKAEVWEIPALGLTQRHLYGQGDTVDFVSMIAENSRKLDRFNKPQLIGEFGITWKEPDIKLDKAKLGTPLHDALWASIFTGEAGGAMTWWWDNYLEPLDLWPVFEGISRFLKPLDFIHRNYQPVTLQAQGLTVLGLEDSKTGETIFWVHDPASNWKNDAAGVTPKEWSQAQVKVQGSGGFMAEVWDTRTGKVGKRERLVSKNGSMTVHLLPFRRDVAVRLVPVR